MRKLWAFLPLAALSCQPGPEGSPGPEGPPGPMGLAGKDGTVAGQAVAPNKSGSRLQVRWTVAEWEDGAQSTVGVASLYDTKLGVSCGYAIAEDTKVRCLPSLPEEVAAFGGYLDAACQQAYGWARSKVPTMASSAFTSIGAGLPVVIYEVASAIAPPTKTYSKTEAMCRPDGVPPDRSGRTFYQLGRAVPPESFVGGTFAVRPAGG
jgi:hypothetical protein